jgi:hypothetical protein
VPDDIALDEPVADRRAPALPVLAVGDPGLPARGAWDRCRPPVALRPSQAHALDRLDGRSACVVLPPGTGKTLVGLEAARRLARRTLVLVPSTVVRAQWLRAWDAFGGDRPHPVPAGTSADLRAAVTVLTYQSLSAWDRGADDQDVEDSTDGAPRRAPPRGRAGDRGRRPAVAAAPPRPRAGRPARPPSGPGRSSSTSAPTCSTPGARWCPALAQALGDDTVVLGLTATPREDLSDRARRCTTGCSPDPDVEVALPEAVVRGEVAPVRDLVHLTRPDARGGRLPRPATARASASCATSCCRPRRLAAFAEWLGGACTSAGRRRAATWRALQRAEPALARAGLRLVSAGLVELPPGRSCARSTALRRRPGLGRAARRVRRGAPARERVGRGRPAARRRDARPALARLDAHRPRAAGDDVAVRPGLRRVGRQGGRRPPRAGAGAGRPAHRPAGARRLRLRHAPPTGSGRRQRRAGARLGGRGLRRAGHQRGGCRPAPGPVHRPHLALRRRRPGRPARFRAATRSPTARRRADAGQRSLVASRPGQEWTAADLGPARARLARGGGTAAVVGTRGLLGEGWGRPSSTSWSTSPRPARRRRPRPCAAAVFGATRAAGEVVHAGRYCVADDHPRRASTTSGRSRPAAPARAH